MVKTDPEGERAGKSSLKVKLSGKGAALKQTADGSAKLKVGLPAASSDPAYSEPEELADSDMSDAEEMKPKKQQAKRPKRQAKKAKRARTPDEVCRVVPYLQIHRRWP